IPLWEQHRNLYVDISWFSISNGLEYLHESGYSDQLLFGTNYPYYTPGAAVTALTYANLTEEVKLRIAGDNLRSILKGIGPS
ncbi:amidohydrolase family protein, partial [Candidatus Neomarinimicrobiota bacterium]